MEPTQLPPNPNATPPADDHLLEDLVSFTGLFNPEVLWQQEEKLDDLEDQEAKESHEETDLTDKAAS
jgi:hypothetical protein